MKLSELLDPKFQGKLKELMDKPLPMKAARKLKKVVDTVNKELEDYEELRKEALKKYGKLDKDGELKSDENGQVQFKKDGLKKFVKENNDLLQEEVKVEKIKLADLGSDLTISVSDLLVLGGIILD